jgi:cell division septation protein DedD
MVGGTEHWHLFDLQSGLTPDDLSPSILRDEGAGRILAFAATPFARMGEWASQATVALVSSMAEEGLRVFLMDLDLVNPTLHERLDLPNQEGVSDAFLYGASVERIARPALDGAIFFASAGTAGTAPEEVLSHPRWNDVAGGFSETDATLLLFLPTDIPGAERVLQRATDIVFLAGREESAEEHLGPAAVKVVAALGPEGSPPEHVDSDRALPEPDEDFSFQDPITLSEGFVGSGGVETSSSMELDWGIEPPDDANQSSPAGNDVADQPPPPAPLEDADSIGLGAMVAGNGALDGDGPADSAFGEGREKGTGETWSEENSLGEFGDLLPSVRGDDDAGSHEGTGSGDDSGVGGLNIPDFGAEFADLPPLDEGGEATAGVGTDPASTSRDFGASGLEQGPPASSAEAPLSSSPPLTSAERPARSTPAPGSGDPQGGAARTRPRRGPPPKKRPYGMMAGAGAVVILLGAAVGTATGIVNVPGFGFLRNMFGEIPLPALTLPGPQPVDPVLRFSLEVFSYEEEEFGQALEMRDAFRSRIPDLLFYLAPRETEQGLMYAVLAGPAIDRIEAENLRGQIAEVITREDPESWAVRETPRAFYLGERGTYQEAIEFLASVEEDGVHGYILQVTFSDGTEGYQVLSGAYEGTDDARALQLMLDRKGYRDLPLIERRGRFPE